jgi:hypothetical protein
MDIASFVTSEVAIGVIAGFVGAFFGGFAKFFWENYLPNTLTWRRQQAQERQKVLSTYRDPMVRAASDLRSRLYNFINLGGFPYMEAAGEGAYAIDSTLYVAAEYFAWAEILAQRIRMLDYQQLSGQLNAVSEVIAEHSSGLRVFRLHQREIGERMVVGYDANAGPHVRTYSEFIDQLHHDPPTELEQSLAPLYHAIHRIKQGEVDNDSFRPTFDALSNLLSYINRPRS